MASRRDFLGIAGGPVAAGVAGLSLLQTRCTGRRHTIVRRLNNAPLTRKFCWIKP